MADAQRTGRDMKEHNAEDRKASPDIALYLFFNPESNENPLMCSMVEGVYILVMIQLCFENVSLLQCAEWILVGMRRCRENTQEVIAILEG